MGSKIHKIKDINDIANLITEENAEFLIADLKETFMAILSVKEEYKKEKGEYPDVVFEYVDIVFDGKKGIENITINGKQTTL